MSTRRRGAQGGSLLLGSRVRGSTWLHRTPPAVKVISLMLASTVVIVLRGPWPGVTLAVLALALLLVAGAGVRRTLVSLRGLALAAVLLSAWNLWQANWARALEQAADLSAMVLLATVLTTSTSVDDIVSVVVRWMEPFRRLGASPEKVALAFSMVLRTVPLLLELARETRDAARARVFRIVRFLLRLQFQIFSLSYHLVTA